MGDRRRSGRVPEFLQVVTTVDSRAAAEKIARLLVDRRLAACARVSGPVVSVYRWKGAVETAREWVCAAKTEKALYPRVERAIRGVHPYEVPEIVATALAAGGSDYLEWLSEQVASPVEPRAGARSGRKTKGER